MRLLEHRIPPPVIALVLAAFMWGVSGYRPALGLASGLRLPLAIVIALAGVAFDLLGLLAFRRSRTTINPLRPDRASALVTHGIYRITRNPMYVGLALLLIAWAMYLDAAWALVGPVLFVAAITCFQIVPEERILRARFPEFAAYAARVRRWL